MTDETLVAVGPGPLDVEVEPQTDQPAAGALTVEQLEALLFVA